MNFGTVALYLFGGLLVLLGGGCTIATVTALFQGGNSVANVGPLVLVSLLTLGLGIFVLQRAYGR